MKIRNIIGIILILSIIFTIGWLLYDSVLSIKIWPEKKESYGVSYKIENQGNKIVYTRLVNQKELIPNIFSYVPKIITTYEFENDIVSNVEVKYYYSRISDAKKEYEEQDNDFFNSNKTISENVVTENMTKLYEGITKNEIISNIKKQYK